MGANIWVERMLPIDDWADPIAGQIRYGTRAEISGTDHLSGRPVSCLDIRAGAGVVLAGLIADGETTFPHFVTSTAGYEGFVSKLQSLGADVDEYVRLTRRRASRI